MERRHPFYPAVTDLRRQAAQLQQRRRELVFRAGDRQKLQERTQPVFVIIRIHQQVISGAAGRARPAPGAEIVGFAYGYAGLPRTWWYGLVAPALSAEKAEFWLGDYFELAEFAVHPRWQGQGTR